ncbi:MAG: hypothetical protein J5845_02750 [Lachnospiraceae bacterium]|nr:hypothetical protein [Lachnospiraceae bacterium]
MKSKNLRILVIAVCTVVIVAEAVLLAVIFGKKRTAVKAEDNAGTYYLVKRVTRYTTPETDKEYKFDDYGRIKEIAVKGQIRKTLPDFSSNYGNYRERFFYDASGNLVRIEYVENGEEWHDDENRCRIAQLRTDFNGGVYYHIPVWGCGYAYSILSDETAAEDREIYDAQDRLSEKQYNTGLAKGHSSCFTYDGNTVLRTDFNDNWEELRTCRFEYDDWGRLVLAAEAVNGYDTKIIQYEYDAGGNLITEDYWDNAPYQKYQIRYTYDKDGSLLKAVQDDIYSGLVVIEEREYAMVLVKEEYLTAEERRELGLPYDPALIEKEDELINTESWCLTDDLDIIY